MAASPLPVLLGIADEQCDGKLSWDQNKLGGEPDWMSPTEHPSCALCENPSYLVVQVYCPLVGSPDHRTLYIFACPEKSCRQKSESWSVLRMQRLAERQRGAKVTKEPDPSLVEEKWTDDADDWGSEEEDDIEGIIPTVSDLVAEPHLVPCSQSTDDQCVVPDMDGLAIYDDSSRIGESSNRFSCYHMNVFNEPEGNAAVNGYEQRLLKEYAEREGLCPGDASWDDLLATEKVDGSGESYEKVLPSHGSASFMKFMKRTSRCPGQCVRYCWSGKPLFISSLPDGTSPPPCQFCGASRVFELQLMPALILQLQPTSARDVSLDFGTVLIYTCSRSCWTVESPARKEAVVLQQDPDSESIGHL